MKLPCDGCGDKVGTTMAVFRGVFGRYCKNCLMGTSRSASSGHASYLRARDREDNSKDLLQPWGRDGKPNREFIRNYPEEAQGIFSEKELKDNE